MREQAGTSKYAPLLENIRRYVTLSPEEEQALTTIIRTTRVKRRQFIVQPGFVCGHRNYVVEGAFRSYYLDDDGKEHTLQIAVEDWFVSDFYSYITQTPATLFFRNADAPVELMTALGIDFDAHYTDDSRELPVPAVFIIDTDGTVIFARSLGGDYRRRVEPAAVLEALKA